MRALAQALVATATPGRPLTSLVVDSIDDVYWKGLDKVFPL